MVIRATVAAAWGEYRAQVLPSTAPPVQVKECRRAFYAGAEMLLCIILNGLSAGSDSSQADEEYMAALHHELLAFAQAVKEGRA